MRPVIHHSQGIGGWLAKGVDLATPAGARGLNLATVLTDPRSSPLACGMYLQNLRVLALPVESEPSHQDSPLRLQSVNQQVTPTEGSKVPFPPSAFERSTANGRFILPFLPPGAIRNRFCQGMATATEGTEPWTLPLGLRATFISASTEPWDLPLRLLARPRTVCLTRTEGSKVPCLLAALGRATGNGRFILPFLPCSGRNGLPPRT
jgi:hypothetical protein